MYIICHLPSPVIDTTISVKLPFINAHVGGDCFLRACAVKPNTSKSHSHSQNEIELNVLIIR